MRASRVTLVYLLLIAIPAQAFAVNGCSCESQAHSADAGMQMAADHMTHDSDGGNTEHGDAHSCDGPDAACECSTCAQQPLSLRIEPDPTLLRAGLNERVIAAYTEPVPIPALRPPISH